MEIRKGMKGLTFVPVKELSEEAKEKLNALMKKKEARLNKIVEDYENGLLLPQ